jgi:hypothetical protein
MKKSIFFLVWIMSLCQTSKMFGQATYNVMYDFYEWGPGTNQGPVDVNFTFNGGVRACSHHYDDLFEFGNQWVDTFPATATLNTYSLRFEWGGNGNETFNYTSDINNSYQPTSSVPSSFWYKKYPLRPYNGDPQYAFWTSNSADWFSTTIWPRNLAIQSITGPESGHTLSQFDQTIINATAGFPADAYTWKYQILDGTGNIISLPSQYQGKSSISFSGNDLFGSNFNNYASSGELIYIYLLAKDSLGNLKQYGNFKVLTPKFNAPKIVSVTAQPAKCSYSTTSSVIIKLDKPVGAGNKIRFLNLVQGITSGPYTEVAAESFNANNEYELIGLPVSKTYNINVYDYVNAGGTLTSHYYITPTVFNYSTNLIPPVLQSGLNVSGVYCYSGQDASLTGRIKGGTSPYTLTYTNTTLNTTLASHNVASSDVTLYATDNSIVKNLTAGNYSLAVTDNNSCIAAVTNTTINQPPSPLSIAAQVETDVTGYGLSNGMLQVTLTGGTFGGTSGYFAPTLKNVQGTVYNAQFTTAQNNQYTFLFNNLPAGNYNFRAEDLNMTHEANLIRDSSGCLAKEIATIIQPPPLLLTLSQTQSIICYAAQTAALNGHATGGKPFTSGKPYLYQWSYSQDGIAAYTALTGNDSTIVQQPAGFYKLIVTDKNSNVVIQTFQVTQPLKVDYDVTIKNVTCLNWTDGALTLSNVRGGTAPYTVTWPDGSSSLSYDSLGHGYYTVTVSDLLACSTSRTLEVKDTLNEITLTQGSYSMPHCFGDSNGVLGVQVTVASKPYTVLWNNGSTDTLLTNIKAGDYTVQVLNSKNCLKQASFTLHTPNAIPLDIDAERYLCIDQTADYDIAIIDSLYQYSWQGPGLSTTDSKVSLSSAGIYTASITDSKGCSRSESVNIHRVNETIASDFVVSTQVFTGDSVSLVNITQSIVSDTCIWEFTADPNLEIITNSFEYATVIFKQAGTYQVGLRSHLGNCEKLVKKDIIVVDPTFDHHPYTGATSYIKNFDIKPNPNDGNFEVMINLDDVGSVKLRLLDFYSNTDIAEVQQYDAKDYVIPMHVTLAPGTYILFLETPYGTRITKVIIMQ